MAWSPSVLHHGQTYVHHNILVTVLPTGKCTTLCSENIDHLFVGCIGIPRDEVRAHQTTHLDITATVVELAGAQSTAPKDLDGLSFANALPSDGVTPAAWRSYSFTEYFGGNNTWWAVRVVNVTHDLTFHWWCTGQAEVFDVQNDPFQLVNLAGNPGLGQLVQQQFLPIATGLSRCKAAECNHPNPREPGTQPLECYEVKHAPDAPSESL